MMQYGVVIQWSRWHVNMMMMTKRRRRFIMVMGMRMMIIVGIFLLTIVPSQAGNFNICPAIHPGANPYHHTNANPQSWSLSQIQIQIQIIIQSKCRAQPLFLSWSFALEPNPESNHHLCFQSCKWASLSILIQILIFDSDLMNIFFVRLIHINFWSIIDNPFK